MFNHLYNLMKKKEYVETKFEFCEGWLGVRSNYPYTTGGKLSTKVLNRLYFKLKEIGDTEIMLEVERLLLSKN